MLKEINIEGTEDRPRIILSKEKGIFEFSGRSLPEDAGKFFEPVQRWIEAYVQDPNDHSQFVFRFDYFNSTSARKIAALLLEIEKVLDKGKTAKIIWLYYENDEMMKEAKISVASLSFLLNCALFSNSYSRT